ncbi:winged helix-turn-helix domain-containing protein [Parasphingorhabdus sp.]|uniref:ArsR/SmtB family transcription factor n=1 Tax=Parasphingorhabdus sp. TaxID=2709688 RepID=UPI001B426A07|nr:winged helix-turn-helix domain-containing protein [Parasphingorhabdus sp.]MBQ0772189.1 winged helix-turn-helix transcriptional regulator [Sphingomonadales bacterium]|tara:strand:+ start:987 stop:1679 length:693 start_codon:yes stop_codon:yes gene_type:complete
MKDGPAIANVAALIGDPARANILTALMAGKALTVSELAQEAGVTLQTTSSHLSKLLGGGMVSYRKQGRHKYFELASHQVAGTIEALMGLAADSGHLRTRTGPRDEALRSARRCYNHLAGTAGVQVYESMVRRGYLTVDAADLSLSTAGRVFAENLGIDVVRLSKGRAPLCRECLDWSERKTHLAGSLGRALLDYMIADGWVKQDATSRAVSFTARGRTLFNDIFPVLDAV